MKTRSKITAIGLFAALIGGASWGGSKPVSANAPEMDSPRSLYVQSCSKCHGADGRADTPKGRELDADDLTSEKVKAKSTASITRTIKHGKGDMPGFGKKLTASEVASIAAYIRSL